MTATRLLSVDDLTDKQLTDILARATEFAEGAAPAVAVRHSALLFLEPSLRTRVGFAAAAQRLGWPAPVEVFERRSSAISMPESLEETAAVLAAYFDALVVRIAAPISTVTPALSASVCVVNGGDRGPNSEHPTQALIDVFAMARLVGDIPSLSIALCGDLRTRSARSLLKLLARCAPRELTLVTDPGLIDQMDLPRGLGPYRLVESLQEAGQVDALHAVGIPHGVAPESVRSRLRVDARALDRLSKRGRVFSPMPVIDEVTRGVRYDGRLAYLTQSALALPVRMAVLEAM